MNVLNRAPTASVRGPRSALLGEARQFTFSSTDPSPADVAGNIRYRVNWGDGTPDRFFHRHRFGRNAPPGALADALTGYHPAGEDHPLWSEPAPPMLVIEEVETIWEAIAERDDWSPLGERIAEIRRLGQALGDAV